MACVVVTVLDSGDSKVGTSGGARMTVVVEVALAVMSVSDCDVAIMVMTSTVPLTASVGTIKLTSRVAVIPASKVKGKRVVPLGYAPPINMTVQSCNEDTFKSIVSEPLLVLKRVPV